MEPLGTVPEKGGVASDPAARCPYRPKYKVNPRKLETWV